LLENPKEEKDIDLRMKVLVCGSSGLVGRDLCSLLEKQKIEYVGIHNSRPAKNSFKINLLNENEIRTFIEKEKPTVCVNCVADRNVDTCEKQWENTKEVNVEIPSILATICSELHIYFLHISTDYVFDGKKSPYFPGSLTNPLQNYGISKLLAELRIQAQSTNYGIIRVPVLYTDSYIRLNETAVTVLAKKVMDSTQETKEDNYSIRRPVFIPDLCDFLLSCLQNKTQGIFHFFNPSDKTTKYEMIKWIGDFLQVSTEHVKPDNNPPSNNAGRPYDTQFLDSQYKRNLFPTTRIQEGIARCFSKFWHPRLNLNQPGTHHVFYLLDLDGTIIETDELHYKSYKQALEEKEFSLDQTLYEQAESIDSHIESIVGLSMYNEVKKRKNEILRETNYIKMVPGANELLDYFEKYNINYVVVTNTSRETVDYFKSICEPLKKVKQWITKDDCKYLKPNPEPYQNAIQQYKKDESYIVAVENTTSGYKALETITPHIYIRTTANSFTHKKLKERDCYFIKDLTFL
jgi:S-adenosylmethionine synthetase